MKNLTSAYVSSASYAAVFSVAPPLSPHERFVGREWGSEWGSDTKNGCVGGYLSQVITRNHDEGNESRRFWKFAPFADFRKRYKFGDG